MSGDDHIDSANWYRKTAFKYTARILSVNPLTLKKTEVVIYIPVILHYAGVHVVFVIMQPEENCFEKGLHVSIQPRQSPGIISVQVQF